MNFDFLEGVSAFERIKPHCDNAEDLVISQPDSSMFQSRKSAEGIAKYIYIYLYAHEVDNMQFIEILNDDRVSSWLGRGRLRETFHLLRRQGNVAVHDTEATITSEEAIKNVERLHYIAGETAKRMGLISKYPSFNAQVLKKTEAIPMSFTDDIAKEMFADYVRTKYVADEYYRKIMELRCEKDIRFINGNVVYNEVVDLKGCPNKETVQLLKEHFGLLVYLKQKQLTQGCENGADEIQLSMELIVQGNNAYTTNDMYEVLEGIFNDVEKSEGFKISSRYYGETLESWFNKEAVRTTWEFAEELIERCPNVSYKYFRFEYNYGEEGFGKYVDGSYIDLTSGYSHKVLDTSKDQWFCWYADLVVDFDFDKYPRVLQELRRVVKKYLPKEEYENTVPFWEDGELGHLVVSAQWLPNRLREIQNFLDEINTIIEPIKDECDCGADGTWIGFGETYIIAKWQWTDNGFIVSGKEW